MEVVRENEDVNYLIKKYNVVENDIGRLLHEFEQTLQNYNPMEQVLLIKQKQEDIHKLEMEREDLKNKLNVRVEEDKKLKEEKINLQMNIELQNKIFREKSIQLEGYNAENENLMKIHEQKKEIALKKLEEKKRELEGLSSLRKNLEDELSEIIEDLMKKEQEINDRHNEEIRKMSSRVDELQTQLQQKEKANTDLEEEIEKLKKELSHKKNHFEIQNMSIKDVINQWKVKYSEIDAKYKRKLQEKNGMEKDIMELDNIIEGLRVLLENNHTKQSVILLPLEGRVDSLIKQLSKSKYTAKEKEEIEMEWNNMTQYVENTNQKIKSLKHELNISKQNFADCQNDMMNVEQLYQEVNREKLDMEESLNKISSKHPDKEEEKLNNQCKQLLAEKEQINNQINELETEKDKLLKEMDGVDSELKQALNDIDSVSKDLNTRTSHYHELESKLASLQEQYRNRSSTLDQIEPTPNIVYDNKLGSALQDMEKLKNQYVDENAKLRTSLNGKVLSLDEVNNKIKNLNKQFNQKNDALQRLSIDIQNARNECKKLDLKYQKYKAKLGTATLARDDILNDLEYQKKLYSDIQEKIILLRTKITNVTEEQNVSKNEQQKMIIRLEHSKKNLEKLQIDVNAKTSELAKLNINLNTSREKLEKSKLLIKELNDLLEKSDKEYVDLLHSKHDIIETYPLVDVPTVANDNYKQKLDDLKKNLNNNFEKTKIAINIIKDLIKQIEQATYHRDLALKKLNNIKVVYENKEIEYDALIQEYEDWKYKKEKVFNDNKVLETELINSEQEIKRLKTELETRNIQYQDKIRELHMIMLLIESRANDNQGLRDQVEHVRKDLEISKKNLEDLVNEVAEKKDYSLNLHSQLNTVTTERDDLLEKLDSLKDQLKSKLEHHGHYLKELEIEKERLEESKNRVDNLTSALIKKKEECDLNEQTINDYKSQIQDIIDKEKQLQSEIKSKSKQFNKIDTKLQSKKSEIMFKKGELGISSSEAKSSRNQLKSMEIEYDTQNTKKTQLATELDQLKRERDLLHKELENTKRILKQRINVNIDKDTLRRKLNDKKRESDEINQQLQEVKNRIKLCKDRYLEKQQENDRLRASSTSLQQKTKELQSNIDNIDYDSLINNLTSDNLNYQKQFDNTYKSRLKAENELNNLEITFSKISNQNDQLKRRLEELNRTKNELNNNINMFLQEIEKLKKEKTINSKTISNLNETVKTLQEEKNKQLRHIEELKVDIIDIESIQNDPSLLSSSISEFKMKNDQLHGMIEITKQYNNIMDITSDSLVKYYENMRDSVNAEINAVTKEKSSQDSRIFALKANLKASKQESIADIEQIKALQLREEALRSEREADLVRIKALQIEVEEIHKLELLQRDLRAYNLESRREELEADIKSIQEDTYISPENLMELNNRYNLLDDDVKRLIEERKKDMDRISHMELELETLKNSKESDVAKIVSLQATIQVLKKDRDFNTWNTNRLKEITLNLVQEREKVQLELQEILQDTKELADSDNSIEFSVNEYIDKIKLEKYEKERIEIETKDKNNLIESMKLEIDIYKNDTSIAQDEINRLRQQLIERGEAIDEVLDVPEIHEAAESNNKNNSSRKRTRSETKELKKSPPSSQKKRKIIFHARDHDEVH